MENTNHLTTETHNNLSQPKKQTELKESNNIYLCKLEQSDDKQTVEEFYSHSKHILLFDVIIDVKTVKTAILDWMLYPIKRQQFFDTSWETLPLYIVRNTPNYYNQLLTVGDVMIMLKEDLLYRKRDVHVGNSQNKTMLPTRKQNFSTVNRAYADGYTCITISNPHAYNKKIHKLLLNLQEYFGTKFDAVINLIPPRYQNSTCTYNNKEVFILQLEGCEHWKFYKPRNGLPQIVQNYDKDNLEGPIYEATLKPGDLLYIHQNLIYESSSSDTQNSVYLTLSTGEKSSYLDLLEIAFHEALQKAATNKKYRQGLPINYLLDLGIANRNKESDERKMLLQTCNSLLGNLVHYIDLDSAADNLTCKLIKNGVHAVPANEDDEPNSNGLRSDLCQRFNIGLNTKICLRNNYSIRLVIGDNKAATMYYFSIKNDKMDKMGIEFEMCSTIESLLLVYPNFISVKDLPFSDRQENISFLAKLQDLDLIVTNNF